MESVCKGISGGMYSSLIVHNPDPIFLLDHIGNIVDVNLAVVDVFGYSTAELKEFSYQDIVTPKFVSELQHSLCKTLQGESCSYHVSAYRKNGEILHLDVKNIPIFDDYQKLINVMIVTKDITDLVQTKAALQETSERLHSIYDSSADAMDIIDLNGNVQKVNKAFEEMYGWKAEEIIGKPMPTILNDRLEMVQTERKKVMNHQYIKGLEVECLRKDGSRIPVSITISPLRDEQGNVIAFAGISRDMSERKKWEEELIRSEEKYRLIAENMTDLVTVVDENGVITYASPSTAPVLGFSPEEYVGIQAFSKAHPEDYPSVDQKVMALFQTKDSCEMEFRYQHNTKDWIWLEAKGTYFIDEKQGQGFALFVSRVIEEKKRLREKLKMMAFHDELTGLPNRRLFRAQVLQSLAEAKSNRETCALLYMDIDRFKWVNDHLGHSVGDELLKQFAGRVRSVLRESDIFARQGGDEFLVFLPNVDEEEVKATASRIVESLRDEWVIGEHSFTTTSSIGISFFPRDGSNLDELLTQADRALYRAKENGRNHYMFYS